MNSFYRPSEAIVELKIHKKGEIKRENIAEKIEEKLPDKSVGEQFNLVYVYYLLEEKFKYPKGESDVLYIGSTVGEKHGDVVSASFRFKHLNNGKDRKQNLTLQYYYEKGSKMGLDLFVVPDGFSCRDVEKEKRYEFLKDYGALPIADGAAYSSSKAMLISLDDELENP